LEQGTGEMNKLILLLSTLVLTGCATLGGVSIEETNYSLNDIRSAIQGIAGEPREVSQNQREYFSQYFSRKKEPNFNPQLSRERSYAHFLILGERRPYEIKVIVFNERKTKNGYELIGEDRAWSKKISEELEIRLNNGRDGRNVIDDFRPF
jgi:hypothetical protein